MHHTDSPGALSTAEPDMFNLLKDQEVLQSVHSADNGPYLQGQGCEEPPDQEESDKLSDYLQDCADKPCQIAPQTLSAKISQCGQGIREQEVNKKSTGGKINSFSTINCSNCCLKNPYVYIKQ